MNPPDLTYLTIKDFRELGFLQEANRLFFHPLGLALEVVVSEDGTETLGGVWDRRDDPEGILYGPDMIDHQKVFRVQELRFEKRRHRQKKCGCNRDGIQRPPAVEINVIVDPPRWLSELKLQIDTLVNNFNARFKEQVQKKPGSKAK